MKSSIHSHTLTAILTISISIVSTVGYADNEKDSEVVRPSDWSMAGYDLLNSHYTNTENFTDKKVASLALKWRQPYVIDDNNGISATPSVVTSTFAQDKGRKIVYFPDWSGNIQALYADNGAVKWKKKISSYSSAGKLINVARTTPVYYKGIIYTGSNLNLFATPPNNGAVLLAIDADTGDLKWSKLVDTTSNHSILTQAPVIYNDVIYLGVSSLEEATDCAVTHTCQFRGSVLAINLPTGNNSPTVKWGPVYMTPPGFTGNSVWGGQPAVDVKRNSIYIATGNNYDVPADYVYDPNNDADKNYLNSIVALDMDSGQVKWAKKLSPNESSDTWTAVCLFNPDTEGCGPDADFGQAPMLIRNGTRINGLPHDILVNGQKSGIFYGLNPDDGSLVWFRGVGPGSIYGGMLFGSATDGKRIYAAVANGYGSTSPTFNLTKPAPGSAASTTGGFWSALDPKDGSILWQTADPDLNLAMGGITAVKGVIFAGSASLSGTSSGAFHALDSQTGQILWTYHTALDVMNQGAVVSSPAVVDGDIFWGSGYTRLITNGGGNKFYAFSIKGK